MIGDPASAPPRPDLTFLRRRSRPKPAPPSPELADFISGRAARPGREQSAASAPAVVFDRPGEKPAAPAPPVSGSLDLDAPASPAPVVPAPTPAAPPAGGSISFNRPGRAPSSGSLDLSDAPAPAPARPTPKPPAPVRQDRRVRAGSQQLLGVTEPTVTLTRLQSGIGQLAIEAVCSPEVGDLRLGAAYQLRGGGSSTVQYTGGNRFAPSSRRPLIVAGRDEYEHLRLDLRRVRELERMAVYAFSESRAELTWGGTLVLTTFGGGRVELPLETLFAGRVAVLMSIYNFDGELVIRAEMETISGDVREAARAYGYDRITWRDDRTPI
ncbi:MAG TPA: hypothetical protein VFL65_07615 [Jatrophihabitans sp.]|nr:hypothetical protein [Jatrophihabitans sp.]